MVLVEVSGISEEMHGLTITVAEDGHSFTISGLPTLEPLRNGGTTTAESTFELTLCYKYKGIFCQKIDLSWSVRYLLLSIKTHENCGKITCGLGEYA